MLPLKGAQVRSLVGELRSCMPHGVAKKKKKKRSGRAGISIQFYVNFQGPGSQPQGEQDWGYGRQGVVEEGSPDSEPGFLHIGSQPPKPPAHSLESVKGQSHNTH